MTILVSIHDATTICTEVCDFPDFATLRLKVRTDDGENRISADMKVFSRAIPLRALTAASKAFNEAMKAELAAIQAEQIAEVA